MSIKNIFKFSALTIASLMLLSGCQSSDSVTDEVTLIVHDSFPNEEFAVAASEATGLQVKVVTSGGGEELTTTLALTKGAPLADAFYGIDNFFASRLVENDVIVPFVPDNLPERAKEFLFDDQGSMVPVSLGATCINIDKTWFAENSMSEPKTYFDLIDEKYKGLTVLLDPTASTTGGSFYLGTIAEFGPEQALDYWENLIENDARIEQGWSDAYYTHFTAGSPDGTYPIVVSYSSSPAYTINDEGTESQTSALLDTCSSTVEYAGILNGANNTEGAKLLIEYLFSEEFQNTIADTMYVYPVDAEANIPAEWDEFAPLPSNPHDVPASEIGSKRDAWLADLSERIGL
ncbi:MAG TPA: thiamine ABC transporter substrate-binding protein [Microbacteriaceae bacterium]|nr:thiamine ABC transporter substrate-binding protein [Microbacteriaceae bacterium]